MTVKRPTKPKLKIVYPLSYNPIIDYYRKIESGEIVVGRKVRRVYRKLVDDIYDTESVYEYSAHRANHAIEFIENYCKHSKGKWGGKPIELELWQKAFIAATFGFVHKIDETRKHQEVFLVVGRKNGKSTLASGIGLYLMIADSEPGAEVFTVATKKDQAKLVWLEAKRMVKKSPDLAAMIKTLVAEMVSDWNDSFFKFLGSDSDTLDGLNVHGGINDEVHAWKDMNLYDVIFDGTSSREQPLIMSITTAGTIREQIYDRLYSTAELWINGFDDEDGYKDDRYLAIVYELDSRKEWKEAENWYKANPGLGTIKSYDTLKNKVNKAKANSRLVKNLLTKDFNMPDTSVEAWLTFEELDNKATYALEKLPVKYAIGGVDLSKTTDLTAAKIIFKVPGDEQIYVKAMYWLPEDLLEKRVHEDKIPYDIWEEQGLLRTVPGNEVHPKYVTEWFLELRDEYGIYIPWIGYDAWAAKYWVEEMSSYFGESAMIAVHQGKKTLSLPMQSMGAGLARKLFNYNNNPIDKWCLSNTAVDIDKNQNIQPVKTSNSKRRIDGTACWLNAFVVYQEKQTDYLNMI